MKNLITGIQPTGVITLGNYLGAIKNFVKLQDLEDVNKMIFIADLHAITVPQDKTALRKQIKSLAALYIACGVDPNKVKIFVQSEVLEHTALNHILQCVTPLGELERMTQYKDKKQKQETVCTGLLTYPVLMAADILLYDVDLVPVGQDQTQHLELTRNIAEKFNYRFGNTFKLPEGIVNQQTKKIMSLQDPTKKMSKSDPNPKGVINILDDLNQIKNKIKSAVTDSDTLVKFDVENKPGISNLMTIYSAMSNLSIEEIENKYKDSNYATFKADLAEVVVSEIKPIQERYNEIINSEELNNILNEGRDFARMLASRKLKKVYDRVGLGRK